MQSCSRGGLQEQGEQAGCSSRQTTAALQEVTHVPHGPLVKAPWDIDELWDFTDGMLIEPVPGSHPTHHRHLTHPGLERLGQVGAGRHDCPWA